MQKFLSMSERWTPRSHILLLTIPIALSAFTHLWNPIGFPSIYVDEGTYIKRAVLVLDGGGPQDPSFKIYDHPYFGQLFLAGVLKLIGYPSSIVNLPTFSSPTSSTTASSSSSFTSIQYSIEMLHLIPRVLMGILAVIDTFLVYKICERRYNNRNVALIASVLFAVMPITWYTRRVLLDSIQLPFLLSSILFAVYYHTSANNNNNAKTSSNREIITVLLSGIFLGLTIFTKIPAFTMIPLVGFLLVYTNGMKNSNNNNNNHRRHILLHRLTVFQPNKKNMKMLGLWLIPVILIPLIWPAYALFTGQFSQWMLGLYFQTHRESFRLKSHAPSVSLLDALNVFFKIDPVLLTLGTAGLGFSVVIKRDFMILLWSIPFLVFLYFIGFVLGFYLIPILPAFCIAAAIMINDLSNKAGKKINVHQKSQGILAPSVLSSLKKNLPLVRIIIIMYNNYPKNIFLSFIILSTIGILGLIGTIILITTNLNSSYFKANAFVAMYTSSANDTSTYSYKGKLTIVGNYLFLLTPQYLLHKDDYYYKDYLNTDPAKTQNVLLVLDDDDYKRWISRSNFVLIRQMQRIYENTFPTAIFKGDITETYDPNKYPLTTAEGNPIPSQIEIRTNVLRLNSSSYMIQTSNGIVATVNNSLYNVVLANHSRSTSSYWNNSIWKNSIKNCGPLFKCMVNSTTGWKDNNNNNNNNNNTSLQISTNITSKRALSSIKGNGIDVTSGQKYQLTTHMKLNQYATQSHVAIEAYNQTSKKWYQITQCPIGTNGPLEWRGFTCQITIPANTYKIRPVLYAGWSSQPGKQAVTLFDALSLSKIKMDKHGSMVVSPVLNTTTISDNSNRIANLCQLEKESDAQVRYKLIEPQVHNGTTLNLVAQCSKI